MKQSRPATTSPGDKDFVVGIIQLANLFTRRLAPLFQAASITPQQWGVLTALSDQEKPATLAGLGRALLVSKQNMTGMIARLEELSLVSRSDDPNDLRSARVQLTRRGRQLIERLTPDYEQWLSDAVEDLEPAERRALVAAVGHLLEKLGSDER